MFTPISSLIKQLICLHSYITFVAFSVLYSSDSMKSTAESLLCGVEGLFHNQFHLLEEGNTISMPGDNTGIELAYKEITDETKIGFISLRKTTNKRVCNLYFER